MSKLNVKRITLAKDKSNLIDYVGGVDKAIEALEVLREHSVCCPKWYMQDAFGLGRASKTVVGFKLAPSYQEGFGFNVEELEKALVDVFNLKVVSVDGSPKVSYKTPIEPPKTKFGLSCTDLWEESEPLILKCFINGEYSYHTGRYLVSNHNGKGRFKITGFNGDWDDVVRGWAYV